jgi:hypothetical protein
MTRKLTSIRPHALENSTRGHNTVNNRRQSRGEKNNVCSRASGIGTTLNSNTNVGLLQGRSIIDTISRHTDKHSTILEQLYDTVLVLWNDLRETIGLDDTIRQHIFRDRRVNKLVGVENGTVHAKTMGNLFCNNELISSDHFDVDAKLFTPGNGLARVGPGRVEKRNHSNKLKLSHFWINRAGDTEGSESTAGKVVHSISSLLVPTTDLNNNLRSTLNGSELFTRRQVSHFGFSIFGGRIEGDKAIDFVPGNSVVVTILIFEEVNALFGSLSRGRFNGVVGARLGSKVSSQ